ncbi:hypothetical protein HX773_19150 [Pantoea sp. B9002]|uniref:hypothetical protein n=1 Tax=Pantoea sp. B9002 TaxID=2726979 RepID=UPI00159FFFC2|nr:hypothetical protein [Pantoea sp. B9002]NWA63027.1 hypothetical protein [Pantoea sp. B9002]
MTNQQLKAHCEDFIANPQDHLDWVVDMARVALASLSASNWVYVRFTDRSKNQCMKCKIAWTDGRNSVIYDDEGGPMLISNNGFERISLNGVTS